MTIAFSPEAENDFRALIDYLVEHNPTAAARMVERIFSVLDMLDAREMEGPETLLSNGEVVRSWAVPPVRVYYQRHGDQLWVLRVYHQARSPISK